MVARRKHPSFMTTLRPSACLSPQAAAALTITKGIKLSSAQSAIHISGPDCF